MTAGYARDDKNASVTLGIAEGYGIFGSVGQGKAAAQSSAQAAVVGGIGPVGGSLTAGTAGITGTMTTAVEVNPGISQNTNRSLTLNDEGLSTTRTETDRPGLPGQAPRPRRASTLSVSNERLDAIGTFFGNVGNALGLDRSTAGPPGSEIGGPIPTD